MSTPYAGNAASYPADYLIPDDGDDINAASVNVALEALGDRTANIKSRNPYYLVKTHVATHEPASEVAPTVIRSWNATSFGAYELLMALTGADLPAVNDIVEVTIMCHVLASKSAATAGATGCVRAFVEEASLGTYISIPGALYQGICLVSGAASDPKVPIVRAGLHFRRTVAANTVWRVSLSGKVSNTTDSPQIELDSGWSCIAKVWRPA